jgi:hypothetical protein
MWSEPLSHERFELAMLWCMLALSALTGLAARLASRLFNVNELPPSDPVALVHWKRRRMYMAISEVCALPAFATGWMAAALQWQLSVPLVVLGSMVSGALGFGFLIHALQTYVLRRVKNG